MSRRHQLKYCSICTKREQNLQEGLICSLTGVKADFDAECESFEKDNTVVVKPQNEASDLEPEEADIELTEQELEKFRGEQNYSKALTVGTIVGLVGGLLWGMITVASGYQIGYMAIAIGAGVGMSMRYVGKGIDQIFGITGGIIALLSCLLGNFFSIIGFIAQAEGIGYMDTLLLFDFSTLLPIMQETFSPMDLLFYGIAAYEGFKFSFRVFTEEDLQKN